MRFEQSVQILILKSISAYSES